MILLVDDDPRILRATSQLLIEQGHVVVTADNGAAGLDRLVAEPGISMIISDVLMPGMNGTAFVARARATRPDIAVLFVSGDVGDAAPADFGGAEVLAKPFTATALLAALDRASKAFG